MICKNQLFGDSISFPYQLYNLFAGPVDSIINYRFNKKLSENSPFAMNYARQGTYIRVGKTGSLVPWSRVIVYCNKLSFCQNDSPIGGSLWQKDSLLQYTMILPQGPKDPVLPTLTYMSITMICAKVDKVIFQAQMSSGLPG